MQLAADPITIEIAGEAYELRPTLRAATLLAQRYGDFATIYRAILADHMTVVLDVIRLGTGSANAVADYSVECDMPGLRAKLNGIKLLMLRYVLALAGHDGSDTEQTVSGKSLSFAEYHAQLYRIGTGWLGWTPEQTWDATPAEIIEARAGRSEMIETVLTAVFGGSSETPATPYTAERMAEVASLGHDPAFDRAAFNELRASLVA